MKKRQAPGVARRTLLVGGAAAASLGWLARPARASTIESARIVLGAPAGGSGDLMARKLADKLRGIYANSVVVDNRTGAGGQIALTHVKDAPGDGSVLLLTPSSLMALYPYTYRKLPYRPVEDFAPVTLTAYANHALAVGPAVPASVKTLSDFLAWAKANPSKASYGSPASGAIPHLLMAYIAHTTGAPLTHVPYRGSAVALQDLRAARWLPTAGRQGCSCPCWARARCGCCVCRVKSAASLPRRCLPSVSRASTSRRASGTASSCLPKPAKKWWRMPTNPCARRWPSPTWQRTWRSTGWNPPAPRPSSSPP